MPLTDWIGREESATDVLRSEPVRALEAALDRDGAAYTAGTAMPPLRHWLSFWVIAPRSGLGRDGHPKLGGFLPDVGAHWGRPARRMWAGSRLEFHHDLPLDQPATRRAVIEAVSEKHGRSGGLVFVTVRQDISDASGRLCVTDRHDIVYREDGNSQTVPEPAPASISGDQQHEQAFLADATLLFRYSALTFNGHRIHYDRDYAREVEGYGGLVVHGPLLATLLCDFARALRPQQAMARFSFRGRRPVIDGQGFTLCAKDAADGGLALWIRDHEGMLAMTAEAAFS